MHIGSVPVITTKVPAMSTVRGAVQLDSSPNQSVDDFHKSTGEPPLLTLAPSTPSIAGRKAAVPSSVPQELLPPLTQDLSTAAAEAGVRSPLFDLDNLDRTTSPTQDFYQFAMGGYLAKKPIPADRARFGVDTEITIANEATNQAILKELSQGEFDRGSLEQKLGDFFKSGMNTEAIERAGLTPLRSDLDRIDALSSVGELQKEIQTAHSEGSGVYFSFYGSTDSKDAGQTIGEFGQGGLSLPEPEYYTSEENRSTLLAYQKHVETMFALAGAEPAQARADAEAVVRLETRLAGISLSTVEMRDPEALYNKMTPEALQSKSDAMDWASYLKSQKAEGQATYNVTTPSFFEKLDGIMKELSIADHKAYLKWHLLHNNATSLATPFEQEDFAFFSQNLRGLEEQAPRISRVTDQTDAVLGEALGQKFVERRFSPEAKAKMLGMVESFKDVLGEKIQGLSWMGPETKKGALEKLDVLGAKIGYPDHPRDYATLEIGPSYIDNTRNAARYERERNMSQIGQPVDRGEWGMTASTNNAYYSPTSNEICFPAGILQPPYFDLEADDAMNYGAIGATIGHELGHGFDDEGAQFDAQGNLRNWFSEDDLARFLKKAEGVEKQFSEYVVEGLPVNGKLVLGEALADLSGLELAYAAYKKATVGQTPQMIGGFTPDQRFFLSFAQSWATNVRPETAKLMVKSDPHPLPKLRVNGTLSNLPEFFEAFGVRPGQPMRRPEEKRNQIWT